MAWNILHELFCEALRAILQHLLSHRPTQPSPEYGLSISYCAHSRMAALSERLGFTSRSVFSSISIVTVHIIWFHYFSLCKFYIFLLSSKSQSPRRELLDPLLLAALADQQLPSFLGHDVIVQALQHDFFCFFGMHHTVMTLIEVDVADATVAFCVMLELVI